MALNFSRLGVYVGAAVPLFLAAWVLGCEERAPQGRVEPEKVETKVGQTVSLELTFRPKHEGVQREIWKVEPAELGEIYYDQATARHRSAVFRAKQAGTGKITVQGFLTDPKPHRVAEVPVTVNP